MTEEKEKAIEVAQTLIPLALQDRTVCEGLKELRQNFDLIVGTAEGVEPLKSNELIH